MSYLSHTILLSKVYTLLKLHNTSMLGYVMLKLHNTCVKLIINWFSKKELWKSCVYVNFKE